MGAQRDGLGDPQRHVGRVDNDLPRAHVNQYEVEIGVMEGLVSTFRSGLVEVRNFVKHTTLTRQQREPMLVQERLNLVIFNMRRRAPHHTDVPVPSSAPNITPMPSSPLPISMQRESNQEGGGEEMQTENENMDATEIHGEQAEEGDLTKPLRNLRQVVSSNLASNHFQNRTEVQAAVLSALDATNQNTG